MKTKQSLGMIALDEVSARFQSHLEIEDNFRIILSGPYGIGKSYFLNDFFDKRKDKYNKIVISPVNYVVSANEDIFELIKADIIVQMILNGTIEKTFSGKLSEVDSAAYFVNGKPKEFISFFTTLVKKISIGGVEIETDFFKGLFDLSDKYDAYKKELASRLKTDYEKFGDFLNAFGETKGNIFEYNFITELINTTLNDLKSQKGEGFENVLIIDDLDRIDPEHIFRILNILSAHNNYLGAKNKFAFDKIILVCDIDNIQKIFAHRYGTEVDFKGYIDKFYSVDIFQFSNEDAITIYLKGLDVHLSSSETEFLKFILSDFLDMQAVNLRQLIKVEIPLRLSDNILLEIVYSQKNIIKEFPSVLQWSILKEGSKPALKSNDVSFLRVLKLLIIIFGSSRNLLVALSQLKDRGPNQRIPSSEILKAFSFIHLIFLSVIQGKPYEIFHSLEPVPGSNQTYNVGWPRVKLWQNTYRFKLQWLFNGGEFQTGEYFKDMEIEDITSPSDLHPNSTGPELPDKKLFYSKVYDTIRRLDTLGLLEKAHL
ncbi:MAG: hypothetical protein JST90_19815 [Bacteroidetes bacterium]|nr:hypothetical protein [Bacteroidota bacterium]